MSSVAKVAQTASSVAAQAAAAAGSVALTKIEGGPSVATKSNPNSTYGRLSILVKGGPIFENQWSSGVSHFVRRMAFRDNLIASNWRLDSDFTVAGIDNEGFQAGLLNRKYLTYNLNGGSETLAQSATLDHLLQCILFPRFHERDIHFLREHVVADQKNLQWSNPADYTRMLVTNTAFKGQPIGNSPLVPPHNGAAIGSSILWDWWEKYVSVQDLLVVGYNVAPDALVDNLCSSNYLQMTHNAGNKPVATPSSEYVGGTLNNIHYKQTERDLQWTDSDNFTGVGFKAAGLNDTAGRVATYVAIAHINNVMNENRNMRDAKRTEVTYESYDSVGLVTVLMRNASSTCMAKLKGAVEGLQNLTPNRLTAAKKAAKIRIFNESNCSLTAPRLIAEDVLYAPAKPFILDGEAAQLALVDAVQGTDLASLAKGMLANPTVVANGADRDTPLSL